MAGHTWKLISRTGLNIIVRPAGADDDAILDELFHHVRLEDLHFRFLAGMRQVPPEQIHEMTHVDHRTVETYIGFLEDNHTPVATAMLAREGTSGRGEVAISIRADYRDHGIGWEMLAFVVGQAERWGLKVIESIESRASHDAIELEKNMGFTVHSYPDDPTLLLVSKKLGTA
ncbi:GNAT family N-acetyltransferase [Mesorhizobium sp. NZP2298]|uniref:GNAT family N-acetyltransferase n=1 Tax=Mesorhizobium sp. NZP2298 TaxID=2483403 RepID=UPI001556E7FC|nr:GNAT family N-acetyltransferase [Mesorhizobium sp. NZP2298]QKC95256.1 N-acetyltransferase [Mesorhizobium sp. NZP2298]